jgi:squalene synthase HpnC
MAVIEQGDIKEEPAFAGRETIDRAQSIQSAYEYCERLAGSHYENFPVGSFLVPRRLRKHFYSIYAFARTADDFADEGYEDGLNREGRIARLADWGAKLRQAFRGHATHPIFIALARTREEFDLPERLFEDLLSAFTQDVTRTRYETFDLLLDYCERSANPVGRLILLLFGYKDEALHRMSDSICTALQLTNHWQDVSIDLDKDRVYLPLVDLATFGLDVDALKARRADQRFARLMKREVERAREFFVSGKPLCTEVEGRLGMELRAVWLGGWRILDLLEENHYDVFSNRPVITSADKLKILSLALRRGAFRRY